NEPMAKIITDRIRPEGSSDAYGVEQAKGQLREAYALLDAAIGSNQWAMGEDFSLVDCAAAPALSYATTIIPFEGTHRNLPGYLDRLIARPSFARVLKEAEPFFQFYPNEVKPRTAPTGAAATS